LHFRAWRLASWFRFLWVGVVLHPKDYSGTSRSHKGLAPSSFHKAAKRTQSQNLGFIIIPADLSRKNLFCARSLVTIGNCPGLPNYEEGLLSVFHLRSAIMIVTLLTFVRIFAKIYYSFQQAVKGDWIRDCWGSVKYLRSTAKKPLSTYYNSSRTHWNYGRSTV